MLLLQGQRPSQKACVWHGWCQGKAQACHCMKEKCLFFLMPSSRVAGGRDVYRSQGVEVVCVQVRYLHTEGCEERVGSVVVVEVTEGRQCSVHRLSREGPRSPR